MYAVVPILACVYATIVFPLIIASCSPTDTACLLEARPENKIFWPLLAVISLIWAARNYPADMNWLRWTWKVFEGMAHPSTDRFTYLQRAFHEYVGYAWYWMLGRV